MKSLGADVMERARAGDPVALCQAMVAIPSVNPELEEGGAGEEALARQCGSWLKEWGYAVELLEVASGRWNVVAEPGRGGGGKRLILNGHLDTVGVAGMPEDPFLGEVRSGRVWGRGACDMKGGLAIIMSTAFKLSKNADIPNSFPEGELVIALTADEEHASVGMQRFVEGAPLAEGAIVCEPTSLAVMPAHKGFLWLEAEFRGKAAHGSRPEEGVDAILHAARFLTALEGLGTLLRTGVPHPLLAFPSFHAGTIVGGTAPSVYPHKCSLVLERRTLPGENPDSVMEAFEEVLQDVREEVGGLDAHLSSGLFRPGTEVSRDSPLVRCLLKSMEAEGLQPSVEGMTAWVDAAFLNEAGIPAVCFGPGSIAQAHAGEEWVSVRELEAGSRVLTRFAVDFLSG